jgi:hypothetical protein
MKRVKSGLAHSYDGVIFCNERTDQAEKTVVIFGCGRGGTSAIAGCLRHLGVWMPRLTHPLKHEWSPVKYRDGAVDRTITRDAIFALNSLKKVWGWKSPKDLFSFSQYSTFLRNPYVILIFRNLLDVCESASRHEAVDLLCSIEDNSAVNQEMVELALNSHLPTALISFEKAIREKERLVDMLSDWLDIDADQCQINAARTFLSEERGYQPYDSATHDGLFSEAELKRDSTLFQIHHYGKMCNSLSRLIEHGTVDLREAESCWRNQISRYKSLLAEKALNNFMLIDEGGSLDDKLMSLINDDNFLSKISTTFVAFRELYDDAAANTKDSTNAMVSESDADVSPALCKKALDIANEYRSLRDVLLEIRKQRFELQRGLDGIEMLLAFLEVLGSEETSVFLGRRLNGTTQPASKSDNDRSSNKVSPQSDALASDLDSKPAVGAAGDLEQQQATRLAGA